MPASIEGGGERAKPRMAVTSLPFKNYVVISMTCMLAVLFQLARQIFQ
jgi:hypothetical protein